MATQEQIRAVVEFHGWHYSPTHGGWIHEHEKRGKDYVILDDPKEIAALYYDDIDKELQKLAEE